MAGIAVLLPVGKGSRVAVVGCDGKTTLVELLAKQHPALTTLVAPTTKIMCPPLVENSVCTTEEQSLAHTPRPGVQYCGVVQPKTGKLCALPPKALGQIAPLYDVVLMEADGSKGLPCKGWLASEPVVPAFTTLTLGVVTTKALGKPASNSYVLRLPQFLQLTGLAQNIPITLPALAAMVAGPGGMFKNAVGRRALAVTAAETASDIETGLLLAALVKQLYPGVVQTCIVGSAHNNTWRLAF